MALISQFLYISTLRRLAAEANIRVPESDDDGRQLVQALRARYPKMHIPNPDEALERKLPPELSLESLL